MPIRLQRARAMRIDLDGEGRPLLPGRWQILTNYDGFFDCRRKNGIRFLMYRLNARNNRGLFAVFAADRQVQALGLILDETSMSFRELWERAQAGRESALNVLRQIRTWQVQGRFRDPDTGLSDVEVRTITLVEEGGLVPYEQTALPWDILPDGSIVEASPDNNATSTARLNAILRPAMPVTLAGWDLDNFVR